jgi:hypothetical protein
VHKSKGQAKWQICHYRCKGRVMNIMPQVGHGWPAGDMAGFGFLDNYIADDEIEEINENSWRDIEIVTRTGWYKIPQHFISPGHAEETLRKMVR